jgi:hypothetical protein
MASNQKVMIPQGIPLNACTPKCDILGGMFYIKGREGELRRKHCTMLL